MIKEIFKKYTDIVTDIKESKLKSKTKLTQLSVDLLDKDQNRLNSEDKVRKIKNKRKYQRKLKKTKLLSLLVLFGCIGSTLASLAGTGRLGNPISPELVSLCFMIIFAQILVFYGSIIATTVKQQYKRHYMSIKSIQCLMLTISIYFNYKFLIDYLHNSIVCLTLCILFDYSIIKYLSLIHDIKNEIEDIDLQDDKNILQKLWYIFTSKLRLKIETEYEKVKTEDEKVLVKTEDEKVLVKTEDEKVLVKTEDEKVLVKTEDEKVLVKTEDEKVLVKTEDEKVLVKTDEVKTDEVKTDEVKTDEVKTDEVKTNVLTFVDLKKVKTFLVKTYKPGQRIEKFQDMFGLNLTEYRKILAKLKKEGIVYTKNKNTYLGDGVSDRDISNSK